MRGIHVTIAPRVVPSQHCESLSVQLLQIKSSKLSALFNSISATVKMLIQSAKLIGPNEKAKWNIVKEDIRGRCIMCQHKTHWSILSLLCHVLWWVPLSIAYEANWAQNLAKQLAYNSIWCIHKKCTHLATLEWNMHFS